MPLTAAWAVVTCLAYAPPAWSQQAPTPAELGRRIFFDVSLSEPQGTSCASCHDPAHGYAGNHGSLSGVAQGSRQGLAAKRNTPSVRYLGFIQPFHFHWEEDAAAPDIYGGLFWDGRADTIAAAVQQPLLNPNEMANPGPERIMEKLQQGSYADAFHQEYAGTLGDPKATMAAIGEALAAFLTSDEMAPFTSKYDDFIRGSAALSAVERQGLALFKDPVRGGCDACHKLNDTAADPRRSLFTDYGFESPGMPRNRRVAANANPAVFDLGVCDRVGNPLVVDPRFCGAFRTPSLRNVGTRAFFMHNGVFSTLRDVVAFYATRATDPARWYPLGRGFDDVPAQYLANIDVLSVPYNLSAGAAPLLADADIDAIVAFLQTLSDAEYR